MIWGSKSLFSEVNGMLLVCLCACVVQFQVGQGGFGCSVLCFIGRPTYLQHTGMILQIFYVCTFVLCPCVDRI